MAMQIVNNKKQLGSGLVGPNGQTAAKKSATGMKRTSIRPVSKERAKENRQNDQIHSAFMQYNPACALCGRPSFDRHHICRGNGPRAASLYDTDTQLATCSWCHSADFGDGAVWPIARQVALKIITIVRKVNHYSTRNISVADVVQWLLIEEQRQ